MEENRLSKRITELDLLRGIAVIAMMLDHVMYDIWGLMPMLFSDFPRSGGFSMKLYAAAVDYWSWDVRIAVRYVFLAVFLGLTGVCCSFSRSNGKRGIKLFGVSLVLTFVTYIAGKIVGDPDIMITFGALHCIALSLVAVGLLERLGAGKWIYLVLGVIMVAVGIAVGPDAPFVSYEGENVLSLVMKQIIGTVECGGDSFPFFLFGGQVFIGVFVGRALYKDRRPLVFKGGYSNNIVTFVGRNSLVVYFAHQVIIPLILGLLLLLLGFKLGM